MLTDNPAGTRSQCSAAGDLNEWEQNFANGMPEKIIKYGAPTEKQTTHVLAIFVKLAGRYDPKTAHVRR